MFHAEIWKKEIIMRKQRIKVTQLKTKVLLQMLDNASGTQKAKIQKELERRNKFISFK